MEARRCSGGFRLVRVALVSLRRSLRRQNASRPSVVSRTENVRRPSAGSRHALLAGVSVVVLLLAAPANARSPGGGGASPGSGAVSAATSAASNAAQQAAAAAKQSQAALLRATQGMQAVQAAARAAARATSSSFNGLGAGALNPVANPNSTTDGLTSWTGANLPTQSVSAGRYDVNVRQTQSRAILSWDSFNVGSATTLTFDQQGNANWVALNRVVGNAAAPSRILGTVKADGTVLVINQNGIIFGGGAQVNVGSLIASTLEVGRSAHMVNNKLTERTIAQRNDEFLDYGLTGYAETNGTSHTFSGLTGNPSGTNTAAVTVEQGALLNAADGGMILLLAPNVSNAGTLSVAEGQVSLASGSSGAILAAYDGSATSADPYIRGYGIGSSGGTASNSGLIEADRGYISIGGSGGSTVNFGILRATTSVSRNGTIDVKGDSIRLAPGSIISIAADSNGETIPQDASSLSAFKSSQVRISSLNVTMESGATISAPSGTVTIGVAAGSGLEDAGGYNSDLIGRITIESGATIDVAGLKDVSVPVSSYNLSILLKKNELADSGGYQDSFLNGATVMIDARRSGVRSDGVAWIGSPLLSAAAYYEAVGVTAAQLMTKGGNVILGTNAGVTSAGLAPSVTVKPGATIDISGGWVTYEAGLVTTTMLLTSTGRIVDIGSADLSNSYVAIASGGFTRDHARWGVTETWTNVLRSGGHYEAAYAEGRDAGSLTAKSAQVLLNGVVNGQIYPGLRQIAKGEVGSGTSSIYGDQRDVQAANTQLPVGGMLLVQSLGRSTSDITVGGGDIRVVAAADYAPASGATVLSDALLSGSGLSQVSLWTSGAISVANNATVSLAAGGVFDAYAGRSIDIAGSVTTPSGSIQLQTANFTTKGSVFRSDDNALLPGSFDITVTGALSVAGRWVNDYGKTGFDIAGPAYLDGGSISMLSAAGVTDAAAITVLNNTGVISSTDVSGSILLADAKLIDLSGGGRVAFDGSFKLTGKGGNLALINQSAFYQSKAVSYSFDEEHIYYGQMSGFRAHHLASGSDVPIPINPAAITSTVQFNADSIRAAGFAGGGSFTLWAPDVKFGSGSADDTALATALPLDFFQKGFASYDITSYKTALLPNAFVTAAGTGFGGVNAVLQTQTFSVKAGETLVLSQALLPSLLTGEQTSSLRGLATGADVNTVLSAAVPTEVWDQKPVDLTLDGMVELKVEAGGSINAAPGAVLTVAKLLNQGSIRLPGGSIRQQQTLPGVFDGRNEIIRAVHSLGDVLTIAADGRIVESEASKIAGKTNASLVMDDLVYLLGELEAADGIVLKAGSVTDLSGISVLDPRATDAAGRFDATIRSGKVYAGGSIVLTSPQTTPKSGFYGTARLAALQLKIGSYQPGGILSIAAGAAVDLDGAADRFDLPTVSLTTTATSLARRGLTPTAVWSDAGAISAPNGFMLSSDAILSAEGGSAEAEGGTLQLNDVVLTQDVADAANELAADQIMASGFTTLAALGSLSSQGDVALTLGRALVVASRPWDIGQDAGKPDTANKNAVVISSGGNLSITAPYIGLASSMDVLTTDTAGTAAANGITLHASKAFDISGAVLFDRSLASVNLISDGDLRLIGVQDYRISYFKAANVTNTALTGKLIVNGDLAIAAAQIYPATGTTFTVKTNLTTGAISFARSTATVPDAPYSAGGNLTVQAATIVQGGVIRVPLGSLTLAATGNLTLTDGSYTEVSANGLIIPYGTTTDGIEWYFSPTGGDAISAPPAKLLTLKGDSIKVASGAVVDVSGSGDVTAYEFAAGTGGSRDVLSRINDDGYTSKTGYTYAGGAQPYAIVPGLSDNAVAAYDPIYSASYSALSSVNGAGSRVLIDIGQGLNWYTLLPAQYATLPGGVLVVQQTGTTKLAVGSAYTRADGTVLAVGSYGNALSGAAQSSTALFAVQSQSVFEKFSSIKLTSGNGYFAKLAAKNKAVTPALAIDAGKLVLNAGSTLLIDAAVRAAAGEGGRGAKVDVGGSIIDIVSALPAQPAAGRLTVTASSLSNLNAESLLVGATRTDNADGSTTLSVSAGSITIANDAAHPIEAGEIVLAATDSITIADGAVITAIGTMADRRDGVYRIGDSSTSGTGALLRVANGPERLTSRSNFSNAARLDVGAATLSGTAIMFDSSGSVTLSDALVLNNAKTVALGAARIGLGVTDPSYQGVVVTAAMQAVLAQTAARLTLRSQTAIDIADGSYQFGDLRLDASMLAGTEGGAVTLSADSVTLGNSATSGYACDDCLAKSGSLEIKADTIHFSGGLVATKATTTAATVTTTLTADTRVILPAGTKTWSLDFGYQNLLDATPILLPAGTVVTLDAGTGVVSQLSAGTTLLAGSEISIPGLSFNAGGLNVTLPEGARYRSGTAIWTYNANQAVKLDGSVSVTLPTGTSVTLSTAVALQSKDFFGGVTLSAGNGIFVTGQNAGLDTGAAALTLHTPYLGDRAVSAAAGATVIPDLTLTTSGALRIDTLGAAALDLARLGGIPGTSLSLTGGSVAVSGSTLHASAGLVELISASALSLSNGAVVEVPDYTATFGDATDSTTATAAAGTVRLTAKAGDITLGTGTLVSVAGGSGNAGRLEISAVAGNVVFGGVIDGTAGSGGRGGVFALESGGGVDLVALNTLVGSYGFTGGFEVRSHSGDLVLDAGQILKSGSVVLTADGGFVNIAGTIDTSGVKGGNIALWGNKGVKLTSTATLDAHANGYADTDSRQAAAGDVTLGTDFIAGSTSTSTDGVISGTSGAITIAAGARIDISAHRPGNRAIPLANGYGYYYVDGDSGGTLRLRAPVIDNGAGRQTVNVDVASASSLVGAKSVVLEAFRRWDLAQVANSGHYTGVTLNNGTITLDVAAGLDTLSYDAATRTVSISDAGSGLNFLADRDASGSHETLVGFIQDFDVSASTAGLGGLAALTDSSGASIFRASPGVELAHEGNITLASSWNLAAGTVDVAGATAANLMKTESYNGVTVPYIVTGADAQVMASYTSMLYRTKGSVTGEAPILSLRAGGDLTLNGILNDGFFSFRDTSDATYLLSKIGIPGGSTTIGFGGGYSRNVIGSSQGSGMLLSFNSSNNSTYTSMLTKTVATGVAAAPLTYVPYASSANSAAPPQTRNPFASMDLLPTLAGTAQMTSSSYRLTGGASVARQGNTLSIGVDPAGIERGAAGSVVANGYSYSTTTTTGTTFNVGYQYSFFRSTNACRTTCASASSWLASVLSDSNTTGGIDTGYAYYWGTDPKYYNTAALGGGTGPKVLVSAPTTTSPNYLIDSPSDLVFVNLDLTSASLKITLKPSADGKDGWNAVTFRDYVKSGADPYLYALYYSNATAVTGSGASYTGNGGTAITGGNDFFTVVGIGGTAADNPFDGTQYKRLGLLVSVKTLNYILNTYIDPIFPSGSTTTTTTTTAVSGIIRTGTGDIGLAAAGNVDLRGGQAATSVSDAVAVYTAGQRASTTATTARDVSTGSTVAVNLAANMVAGGLYLSNGGDIGITAGRDVLGRSGGLLTTTAGTATDWIVNVPRIGNLSDSHLNPAGFTVGVGALAGGDITIAAGRDINDVPAIATSAARTAVLTLADGSSALALQDLAASDVAFTAGRDILGGRVSVSSGVATLAARRDIAAAAGSVLIGSVSSRGFDRKTRLSFDNGTATATAGRDLALRLSGSAGMSLSLLSAGDVSIVGSESTGGNATAILPGSVSITALTGDMTFNVLNGATDWASFTMMPDPNGQLVLLAGGSINPVTIIMSDVDPANLASTPFFPTDGTHAKTSNGLPVVTSTTTEAQKRLLHNEDITHASDPLPVFIAAGGDIRDVTLGLPKQARIIAGGDIVNMMFFGQNLAATDITRIAAGGDITATASQVVNAAKITLPTLHGNTFVIGGPGAFFLEAGGDIGPFLNSAVVQVTSFSSSCGCDISTPTTFGGGVMSVGYDWNPGLKSAVKAGGGGADLYVMFGLGAIGADYTALRDRYVDPANGAALTWGGYGTQLVQWMRTRHAAALLAAYGTTAVNDSQAYEAFTALSALEQRIFLLSEVYFNELEQVGVITSPSYQKYSRGYEAVNTLFPAANGFTANGLEGGAVETARVHTGNLDLRLATLQTTRGGDIRLLGPGGDIIAGSVVRTSTQAARRNYNTDVYGGTAVSTWAGAATSWYSHITAIDSIPVGLEGILTLRGGQVSSFTDGSLVLNQSRLFTKNGGDILAWSSNGDLNAGQGPKTSANFPPVVIDFDWDLYGEEDEQAGVSGAGIAAFQPAVGIKAPDVYLLAPRGIVDAGDAGVRVAGNLSIVAYQVRNADNVQVGGTVTGLQMPAAAPVAMTAPTQDNAANNAVKDVTQTGQNDRPSVIIVEVLGYGGGSGDTPPAPKEDDERRGKRSDRQGYDPNSMFRVVGSGELTEEQMSMLTADERRAVSGR
uniref:Filamentous haemagglutinin family outer membrane protein n=1 Tax=Rhodopseudomonas palustris (strain BisA53) TaxID=316055 RepID=Q07KX9_RHOP5